MRSSASSRPRLRLVGLAVAVALSASSSARAQAPAEGDLETVAAARSLGVEGVKLADAGKCDVALEKLARAERLHHAPTILGRLGECQVHTGKLVEGTENLARVVREPLPPNPPPAFVKAKARAQAAYDAAKPRIAKLSVSVKAPPATAFAVTIDGQALSSLVLESDRPTDPGEHVIEAKGDGLLPASQSITLTEGQRASVALKLETDPRAAAAIAAVPATAPVVPAKPVASAPLDARPLAPSPTPSPSVEPLASGRGAPRSQAPAYVAFGLGAAGLGVGAVFGALALSGRSDITRECPNKVCPESSRDTLDQTRTYGTVSTVGVMAGAGLFAIGAVLYVSAMPSRSSPDAQATRGVRVSPFVGLGGGGVNGSF